MPALKLFLHRTWLAALIALTGCAVLPSSNSASENAGDNADAVTTGTVVEPKSGSRLRALYWKRGTTAVASGTYRDTKLDEICQFAPTEDGWRCLPIGGRSPGSYTQAVSVFADATCTTPGVMFRAPTGEPRPKYARVDAGGALCGTKLKVVALGAAATPATKPQAWTKQADGRCVAQTLSDYYTEVSPFTALPLTDFVKGTQDRATVTADLAADRIRGEDGSISPNGIVDPRRDTLCYPDAAGRCMPLYPAYAADTWFGDAACAEPAAYFHHAWGWGTGADVCKPRIVRSSDSCDPKFFEVGTAIAGGGYSKSGTTCSALTPTPMLDLYRIGAPIPLTAFPTIATKKENGILRTVAPNGGVLTTSFVTSAATGERACNPTRTEDGKVRCLPNPDLVVGDDFGDAACTKPVALAPAACTNTQTPRPQLAVHYGSSNTYYNVASASRKGPHYRVTNGKCEAFGDIDLFDVTPMPSVTFEEIALSEEACHPLAGTCSEVCAADTACNGGFCSASVCLAKIANDKPLPSELGACTPDVAKRACMSGTCAADGKCGVPRGGACTKNDECRSDGCNDKKCQPPATSTGGGTDSTGGGTDSTGGGTDPGGKPTDPGGKPSKPGGGAGPAGADGADGVGGSDGTPPGSETANAKTPAAKNGGCSTSAGRSNGDVASLAACAMVLAIARRRRSRRPR